MFNITEQTCFKILIFEIVSNKFPQKISFYLLFTFISILQPQFAFNLKPKILIFLNLVFLKKVFEVTLFYAKSGHTK